jgi:2-polyprenyl-3-methyl-5-hydroxy-6-metoxy-1,4-benzoquinol methylase
MSDIVPQPNPIEREKAETQALKRRRDEVAASFGQWSAHPIQLAPEVATIDQSDPRFSKQIQGHGTHLRRILQSAADVVGRPLQELRVLDLACLEGLYGIEFARHGAEVVGIEGREANLAKALFARDALGLKNATFVQDDVRNLCAAKYGRFDIVLALGILYHLDVPAVFPFVERIAEVCTRLAVIDTHVSVQASHRCEYKGQSYQGRMFQEHASQASAAERQKNLWASLDNEVSFWFTRPSLFNLLAHVGFTSAFTCQNPAVPTQGADRDTILAVKGQRLKLHCIPQMNAARDESWPENSQAHA